MAVSSEARDLTHTEVMNALHHVLLDLGVPLSALTPSARLGNDLNLDSTEAVQVSLQLKRSTGTYVKLQGSEDLSLDAICRLVCEAAAHPVNGGAWIA